MPRPPSKAQTVADQLAIRIAAGDYQPGAWLPARRDLGAEYNVDRGTVSRALRMLAERGMVNVIEGNGARVTPRTVSRHRPEDMTHPVEGKWLGFGASARRAGKIPYTVSHGIENVEIGTQIARQLGVPIGTTVLERARVHGHVEPGEVRKPVEVATTWILQFVVERIPVLRQEDTGPGGMTARLLEAGFTLRYQEAASARMPDLREQELLQLCDRQPVLVLWRKTFDQTDRVIKASRRVINTMEHEVEFH